MKTSYRFSYNNLIIWNKEDNMETNMKQKWKKISLFEVTSARCYSLFKVDNNLT